MSRFSGTHRGAVLLAAWLATAGMALVQEPNPAAVRARLADATPLTPEEIGLAVEVIKATVGQRPFKVTDGTQSVAVDDGARAMLLLMLSGTVAVADLGLHSTPTGTVRRLRSPATPPRSEVGANQILWIDVESLVPRRFEFLYDVPGMGDISYDLIFD